MKKFVYWDNKKVPSEVLFETTDNTILEADKKFKSATGLDVIKHPWIGCTVENLE